jgi:integrase
LYQKPDDVRDKGEAQAPWLVGWLEPDGRRRSKTCGPGESGRRIALKLAAKITAQLMTGTYEEKPTKTWDEFLKEYTGRILDGLERRSKAEALTSLAHFKRLVKPSRVYLVCTANVDDYISRRRREPGKKKGSTVSPATINKELRQVKAALNAAVEWEYLKKAPKFRMERQPKKLVRFVTGEHFTAIYTACDQARLPRDLPYPAADWWRGLMMFAYMTGWRIGDLLALRRFDLDLDTGHAITRWTDNKGDRDDKVKLHPVVIEHLGKLSCFDPMVFPWHHDRRTLDSEWHRIQAVAGINLPCRGDHEHTPACHVYGFHDLRRAFATDNAPRLTSDTLQGLMRHKSYLTTQVYINMARQLDEAVNVLRVPDVAKRKEA